MRLSRKANRRVPVAFRNVCEVGEGSSTTAGLEGPQRAYKRAPRSCHRGAAVLANWQLAVVLPAVPPNGTHGSRDGTMAAASVVSIRSVVSPSRSLGSPCLPHQSGVRAAASEAVTTAEAASPPHVPASTALRPPVLDPRPKPAPSAQLTNFRVWILCDGSAPLVARFVLASFHVPEDGGVDAVRRALRASALAAPPYNVFVRPWARVAYVKAAEVGDGIRRLDNKQSDTMRALLAEEARSPGGMVLCVEQTRNPKYKAGTGNPDVVGQTTVR